MKLYFTNNLLEEDFCYTLEKIKKEAKKKGLNQIEIFEAEKEIGSDAFFCNKYSEIMGKGFGYCGKECNFYQPRNGKSGICKHNKPTYLKTNKKLIINL
jgi:hypothetical protein